MRQCREMEAKIASSSQRTLGNGLIALELGEWGAEQLESSTAELCADGSLIHSDLFEVR